ncbi:MAG TPA: hypothetical protein VF603_12165 [Allosphingosinicella sp.]
MIVWLFWRGAGIARGEVARGQVATHVNYQLFRVVGTLAGLLLLGGGAGLFIGSSVARSPTVSTGAPFPSGDLPIAEYRRAIAECDGGRPEACAALCRDGDSWRCRQPPDAR